MHSTTVYQSSQNQWYMTIVNTLKCVWFHRNVTHSGHMYCREWVSFPWWGAQLLLHNSDCFAFISSGQKWAGSIGPEWKLIHFTLLFSVFNYLFPFVCWLELWYELFWICSDIILTKPDSAGQMYCILFYCIVLYCISIKARNNYNSWHCMTSYMLFRW